MSMWMKMIVWWSIAYESARARARAGHEFENVFVFVCIFRTHPKNSSKTLDYKVL